MFKSYVFRLYPTASQSALLYKHFGCVRWVYNKSLAMKIQAWNERKESLSRYDLCKMLPVWKKSEEASWLADVNAQSLQGAIANLDAAYARFFRLKKGFPKFKTKRGRQSFTVPQRGTVGDGLVEIPKVGKITARISRQVVGEVRKITISLSASGKFFASVLCDDGRDMPDKKPITKEGTVGIDLGLKDFAVLSTGERILRQRNIKLAERSLRRAQKRLSRCVIGSNNRNKRRLKVALIHEMVSNRRMDFLHKLTSRLVSDNQRDTFAIEDLFVSGMMQNRRLAKSISDVGWGEFRRQLQYKSERAGKNVLVIGRFEPSSKACTCGKINESLTLSDRVWTCTCGEIHDRDLLAANNIKRFALCAIGNFIAGGTGEYTPAEIVTGRSLKQESNRDATSQSESLFASRQ